MSHWKLLLRLLQIAVPSGIGLVLSELPFQTMLVYIGKLGDKEMLAGAGLAISMINCLCMAVTVGISSVLETLVSQSYSSGQYKLCGLHFNRNLFVMFCLFIPIGAFLWFSEFFMANVFGQNEVSARYCQTLLRYSLPGMLMECLLLIYQIFFTAMGRSYIPMMLQLLVFPVHLACCELFVIHLGYGLEGTAIALNVAIIIPMMLLLGWLKF